LIQQTQFLMGGERIVSVRMPLTTETNFSLKIPSQIRPGRTPEEFRVLTVLHWMLWDPEIERDPGVAQAQAGTVEKPLRKESCEIGSGSDCSMRPRKVQRQIELGRLPGALTSSSEYS
jgi:hypothetical protein